MSERLNRLLLFLCLAISLFFSTSLFSKSFSLDKIDIRARIQADGHLQIEENRTYTFRGSFSWADYRLPLKGIGEIRSFSISDEFSAYQQSAGEEPGTYFIQKDNNVFYVKWYYRARNETRTFTLRYLASDVVTRYQDVAELYFKFVGPGNNFPVQSVQVILEFPQDATFPEVRVWAHGPLWGEVRFVNGNLKLSVSPLPARNFWEVRTLFPPEWAPAATRSLQQSQLDVIMKEEEAWAKQANLKRQQAQERMERRREREAQAMNYAVAISLIGLLGIIFLYNRFGKGHQVNYHQKVSSELPLDEPPAFTSIIFYNKQVYGVALTATLLDLARRGYLSIEQTAMPEQKWWGIKPPQFTLHQKSPDQIGKSLLDYEESLLDFIFRELGQGSGTVNLKTFSKNRRKVQRWFMKWKKQLSAHLKETPYYDKDSIRGTIIAAILSAVVFIVGVVITIIWGTPGITAVIAGSLFIGLSFMILSYTPEIKLRRQKLKTLKNYLKSYHFIPSGSSEAVFENIDSYLIYGMALGLGKKQIEKMMMAVPANQQQTYFPWYVYPHGGYASPEQFASAVSTMVTIASSTVSSSAGAGGGASGGGGGGGGGASGGAG
jgi:uncharacterized membrane protein